MGKIETHVGCEVVGPSSLVAATDVGVRWLPVPSRGDPRRGALVSAVNLSYRDVEELLVERGVEVDHVTVYRWVQRFRPLLADAARFCRHSPGDRWLVDETDIKVKRAVALRVPGRGPVQTGHRRAGVPATRHRGGASVERVGFQRPELVVSWASTRLVRTR
jgi:hypothetical protein